MSKIIRLTETDLTRLVKRIVKEAPTNATGNDRIANIANILASVQKQNRPVSVIVSNNPKLNGMTLGNYLKIYKVTNQEIIQARELNTKMGREKGGVISNTPTPKPTTQKQTNAPTTQAPKPKAQPTTAAPKA